MKMAEEQPEARWIFPSTWTATAQGVGEAHTRTHCRPGGGQFVGDLSANTQRESGPTMRDTPDDRLRRVVFPGWQRGDRADFFKVRPGRAGGTRWGSGPPRPPPAVGDAAAGATAASVSTPRRATARPARRTPGTPGEEGERRGEKFSKGEASKAKTTCSVVLGGIGWDAAG